MILATHHKIYSHQYIFHERDDLASSGSNKKGILVLKSTFHHLKVEWVKSLQVVPREPQGTEYHSSDSLNRNVLHQISHRITDWYLIVII